MICGIAQRRSRVYEAVEYLKSFKNVKYNGKIVDAFLSFTAVYPAGSHVLTNDGEEAIVVSQNKDFQDRPIIGSSAIRMDGITGRENRGSCKGSECIY